MANVILPWYRHHGRTKYVRASYLYDPAKAKDSKFHEGCDWKRSHKMRQSVDRALTIVYVCDLSSCVLKLPFECRLQSKTKVLIPRAFVYLLITKRNKSTDWPIKARPIKACGTRVHLKMACGPIAIYRKTIRQHHLFS